MRRLHLEPLENRCLLATGLSATLVADIVPGVDSSNPHYLTNVDGTLYFGAKDPTGGVGLWKSDGTAGGTVFIKNVGPAGAAASDFTPIGETVLFRAYGYLWKSDGTAAGTSSLMGGNPENLTAMNGKVFFAANETKNGRELWVSDGTKTGTKLVKDIYSGSGWFYDEGDRFKAAFSSNPAELTNLSGTLLFAAVDGANGRELWRSDGTSKGTDLVKDIATGSIDSNPQHLTIVGDAVYFVAAGGLWKTNGTTAGTVLVKKMEARHLTNVNGTLFFAGYDSSGGFELWKSDGTAEGTVQVKNVEPGSFGSWPENLTNVNGTLYFSANDGTSGRELWKSDGTAECTILVNDVYAGAGSSSPTQLTNVNGLLYFAANDGANGNELWQSDGTAAGTAMVRDIYPGSGNSDPGYLTSMNSMLYFAATDPEHGRELWDPPPVEPSADYLLVSSFDSHTILRYDADTGAFVDEFLARKSGGLNQPMGVVVGPHDRDVYVSTGLFAGPGQLKAVLRFDGGTGAFVEEFTKGGDLQSPRGIIFGPDGNLYVSDRTPDGGRIAQYDGTTGAFMGDFVAVASGGLRGPQGLVFAPDGNKGGKLDLFVSNAALSNILRYDGTTGAFLGEFVPSGSGGLDHGAGLTFGPDGNLYVAQFAEDTGNTAVLRFQGPSGETPSAPMPAAGNSGAVFIPAGSGGLFVPYGLLFGPDGNYDGHQDLYVTSSEATGFKAKERTSTVKRYDGVSGAFLDTFVGEGSGRLDNPSFLTFTETDPVTLSYIDDIQLTAASSPSLMTNQWVAADDEPRISISDVAKYEGKRGKTTLFTFTVTLSAAYDEAVTMSFRTVNGTATTGNSDYIAKTGTLTFAPGETTKTITIEVKGDSKKEANEIIYLDLFGNSSNSLFTKNRGIGTILNDD